MENRIRLYFIEEFTQAVADERAIERRDIHLHQGKEELERKIERTLIHLKILHDDIYKDIRKEQEKYEEESIENQNKLKKNNLEPKNPLQRLYYDIIVNQPIIDMYAKTLNYIERLAYEADIITKKDIHGYFIADFETMNIMLRMIEKRSLQQQLGILLITQQFLHVYDHIDIMDKEASEEIATALEKYNNECIEQQKKLKENYPSPKSTFYQQGLLEIFDEPVLQKYNKILFYIETIGSSKGWFERL